MEEPARKIGPYDLVSRIGQGTFGVVWLAERRASLSTTRVALKLPRSEDIDLEIFRCEADIWMQASGHTNVLPLIEAEVYDGQVVIVSAYAPDGSLEAWRTRYGGRAPSVEAACEMMEGVLSGLAHLHRRRIIHRDLKPDNILLQEDTPLLADFGISRVLRSSSHFTKNVSGTFAYMAPEAFDGKRDEQTDIWAVGVIFYELLAGRLPFDQQDTASLIGAIVRYDPPELLPGSVPEVLRRVVSKALRRDPAERYRTADEMRRELREAGHQLWLERQGAAQRMPETRLAGDLRQRAPEPHVTPNRQVPVQPVAAQMHPVAKKKTGLDGVVKGLIAVILIFAFVTYVTLFVVMNDGDGNTSLTNNASVSLANANASKANVSLSNSAVVGQTNSNTSQTDDDYHFSQGASLYKQKKYAEAAVEFRKAIQLNPTQAVYYNELGNCQYGQLKYSDAELSYREANRLNPSDAILRSNLGNSLYDQKKYTQAETAYKEAIKLNPRMAEYHNWLGNALFSQSKYAEAEAAYKEALKLDPTNVTYKNNLKNTLDAK